MSVQDTFGADDAHVRVFTAGSERLTIMPDGRLGIDDNAPSCILEINDGGAVELPAGDDSLPNVDQAEPGMVRYNTQKRAFEGYIDAEGADPAQWVPLADVADKARTARVTVQDTFGTDVDVVRVITGAADRLVVQAGNVAVMENVQMHAGLDVTGAATVGAATLLRDTLTVDGGTHLKSTLTVDGATTLDDTLLVTGAATTEGASHLKSTLTVDGDTVLGSNLRVDGNLTVEGSQTVLDSVTVRIEDRHLELAVVDAPTDVTAEGGGVI